MTKELVSALLAFLLIGVANGQTASDLASKYQHHEVYEVQPGVQMTPKFDSDGLVCQMQIEASHFAANGVGLRDGIDETKIWPIVDQLVPVSERGAKLNTIEECMGVCQMIHEYVNVTIKITSGGSTRLITIKWRNRNCG
jgi:hypothetical protein